MNQEEMMATGRRSEALRAAAAIYAGDSPTAEQVLLAAEAFEAYLADGTMP